MKDERGGENKEKKETNEKAYLGDIWKGHTAAASCSLLTVSKNVNKGLLALSLIVGGRAR